MAAQRDHRLSAFTAAAIALVGASLAIPGAMAWPVDGGGDVTIDNLSFKSIEGDSFVIAHVEFTNTNLTKDEVVKLLSPDLPPEDERALALKLKAEAISIPSIDILGKDGSKIHLGGLTASHVDAGKIESLDFTSITATGTENGAPASVKSGALHIDGLDAAQMLAEGDSGTDDARPSHLAGLALSGLDIVAPDFEGEPGQTIHIALGAIDLHNDYAGDAPTKSLARITGVVIEPSAGSETGKAFASLGYSKLELALTLGMSYQPETKALAFDDITLEGAQMGSISLKAAFTDVGPQVFGADSGARTQAIIEAGVASLELKLVNAGLFEKGLADIATQQNVSVDELRRQWSTMAGTIAPVMLGGNPGALALGSEVQKFIADPRTLSVVVKARNGALKAGDFMTMSDPAEFAAKLDISAAANR